MQSSSPAFSSSPQCRYPAASLRPAREARPRSRARSLPRPRIWHSSFVLLLRPPRSSDPKRTKRPRGGSFMESYVRKLGVVGLVALAGLFNAGGAGAGRDEKHIEFEMVPSAAATT